MPPTAARQSPIQADLLIDDPRWTKARLGLGKLVPLALETALRSLPKKPKAPLEVTVTFSTDKSIRVLNRTHRGKDKPTNVLSFPLWDSLSEIPPSKSAVPIGDIVIAIETMQREAVEQHKTLKAHLTHMLVHGFLHLLGYDHITDKLALEMETLEIKILKKLAINNPYAE